MPPAASVQAGGKGGANVDLKQLDYFVHVAELGSFTRAATQLAVVQSALSRQIRALEVELRQPLFQRNGRGVTLTEAGKRLLEHGRGILQQVERARLDIENLRGAATGRLVIGLPPSVSRTLTGPLVGAFRQRFPQATLSVVEGLSTYVMEWLAIGRVDCAVVYNVAPSTAVDLLPVLNEPLFLVSARAPRGKLLGRGVSLADVAGQQLVIPSRPHSIRMLLEAALAAEGPQRQRGARDREHSRHPRPGSQRWLACGAGPSTRSSPAAGPTTTPCTRSASRISPRRCGSPPRRSARAGR